MRPKKKFGEADIDGKHPSMSLVSIDLHSGTTGTSYGQKMAQKYENNDFLHEVTLNVRSVAKWLRLRSGIEIQRFWLVQLSLSLQASPSRE